MIKIALLSLAAFLVPAAAVAQTSQIAEVTPSTVPPPEAKELQRQLEEMRSQIIRLQGRLSELEASKPADGARAAAPPGSPDPTTIPQGATSPHLGNATATYQNLSEDSVAAARFNNVPLDPKYHGYFRLPGTQTLLRVFRSIRTRNYRLYFSGQMVSVLGSWLQSVAQSWLVYRLTGSPLQLGLVAFVSQAPLLFLSPIGGIIADRYPRRWVVMGTQISSMLLAFALAALYERCRQESRLSAMMDRRYRLQLLDHVSALLQ